MDGISFKTPAASRFIGLGLRAFDRAGLERYLPNYSVISLDTLQLPPSLARKTTASLLESPECKKIIQAYQKQGDTIFCLPHQLTPALEKAAADLHVTLLANNASFQREFENKGNFRRRFAERLPFPDFSTMPTAELSVEIYQTLQDRFGNFIIQDTVASGGKGSYRVRNQREFEQAVTMAQQSPSTNLVISRLIVGQEASVQACVTQAGVLTLPLQEQIVGDPALVNTAITGKGQFCGGQWGYHKYSEDMQTKAQTVAQIIGQELQQIGYKGIFGVDFLIDDNNQLFVLETNARLTGLTAVLAQLQEAAGQLPFILFHVLELANIPYTLSAPQQKIKAWPQACYAVLHNRQTIPVEAKKPVVPGMYQHTEDGFSFVGPAQRLEDLKQPGQILIIDTPAVGIACKPGELMARIISREALFEKQRLTPGAQKITAWLESQCTPS